jgi:hypothetical protein
MPCDNAHHPVLSKLAPEARFAGSGCCLNILGDGTTSECWWDELRVLCLEGDSGAAGGVLSDVAPVRRFARAALST